MINGVGGASSRIEFNPTSALDLPQAAVKARIQIAVLKSEQDMMLMQGRELARLIEPHKGGNVDARA
jgi:hypothetical protein